MSANTHNGKLSRLNGNEILQPWETELGGALHYESYSDKSWNKMKRVQIVIVSCGALLIAVVVVVALCERHQPASPPNVTGSPRPAEVRVNAVACAYPPSAASIAKQCR